MKLLPKKGTNQLTFGQSRSEVADIYGPPDREMVDQENDNEIVWEYTEQKLRLTFYPEEAGRLGYIRSSNPQLEIDGLSIIDRKVEEVLNHIEPNRAAWEKDDYDFFTTYFYEPVWLTLNVEFERVTHVELGVAFGDDDAFLWPE